MKTAFRYMALAAVSAMSLSNAYAEGNIDYPETSRTTLVGKTRDQVRQELAEAVRSGQIVVGRQGRTLAEQYPNRYAGKSGKRELVGQRP